MRKLLFCFIFYQFTGCFSPDVSVRSEKRLRISGQITGANNNPINNILVESGGSFDNIQSINNSNRLGDGKSDTSGNFSFISLDTDNSLLTIVVNSENRKSYNPDLETISLIDMIDDHGTFLDFEPIVLRGRRPVEIILRKTSEDIDRIDYRLQYETAENHYLIENRQISSSITTHLNAGILESNLTSQRPERTLDLSTLTDTEIVLSYQIDNQTSQDTIFYPSSTQNTYTFEF